LSTSQAPEELADNAGKILTKFGKEEKHIEFEHEPTPEKVSTVADKGTKGWLLKDTPEQLKQPVKQVVKRIRLKELEEQLGLAIEKMASFSDTFVESQKTIEKSLTRIGDGLSEKETPKEPTKSPETGGITLHIENINIFYK